jgi:non-specific serine/threonine protein kinase/serine/threonine-protein kinase
MTPDWTDVEAVFAAALEQPSPYRAAYLADACKGRPDLRAEVESLLASHDSAADFLDAPLVQGPAEDTVSADAMIGQRVGPFILEELIGRGGMGVVFRAERRDGDFTQRVAVKVVEIALRRPEVWQRFRSERQILATLSHPNIVSLLDGGVTPQGQAYLVMEYVEGVPITTYCARKRLGLADRLALVQRVCGAVQYAHQHGVVHRDLKPANILVTGNGEPKVLDFGISKLRRDDESDGAPDTTDAALRPLTPNYASPEQWRGLPVTTACDIYALGVLLYELVSGVAPYRIAGQSLDEILRTVLEVEPPRPSAAGPPDEAHALPYDRKQLRGDLDAIVLKAMRKAPAERYASARELGEDLDRWRRGLPVVAREPSVGYLLARLARRHRGAVAAASISLVALVAALGVSLWEARIARAESTRATARFNDTRQIADGMLFRLEGAVGTLPGSTPVRRQIVSEALTYLERLSRDPAGDDALRIDLARGYHRVGDIQGIPSRPNLGDREGAVTSYQRAIDLLTPITTGAHPSRDARIELARTDLSLASTLSVMNRQADARRAVLDAQASSRRVLDLNPKDREGRRELASSEFTLALLEQGVGGDLPHWQAAGAQFESLLADDPSSADAQRNVALVQKYIGSHYEQADDFAQALVHHLRAKALDETRLAARPDDRQAQFDVAIDLSNVAYAQWRTDHPAEAAVMYEQSLAMRKQLAAFDPNDVLARSRVAFVHTKLSAIYGQLGRTTVALEHAHEAVKLAESMVGLDVLHRIAFAQDLQSLGVAEGRVGDTAESCLAFRRSFDAVADLAAKADLAPSFKGDVTALVADDGRALHNCPRPNGK